jgi:uncharacterized glyoxalase superfamily protein PhnB
MTDTPTTTSEPATPAATEPTTTEPAASASTKAGAPLHGVTPYLYYDDAGAGLDWLARVFGFVEEARYVDDDGVVRESEMRVGSGSIQLCGHAQGSGRGEGLLLIVHVDDVAAQHARVVAAGVDAPEPELQPYGVRSFTVTDPWGYHWDFWQRVHAVPEPEEGEGGLREIRTG